jgi:ssDNA-binding Zn-finger/Zn-ribbon topoisomerase 1
MEPTKEKKLKTVKCPNCGHKVEMKKEKKEKRKPSEYNEFMGKMMKKIKKENPDHDHKKVFELAVNEWNIKKVDIKADPEPKEPKTDKAIKKFAFF